MKYTQYLIRKERFAEKCAIQLSCIKIFPCLTLVSDILLKPAMNVLLLLPSHKLTWLPFHFLWQKVREKVPK